MNLYIAQSFVQLCNMTKMNKLDKSMALPEILRCADAAYTAAQSHFDHGNEELEFLLHNKFKSALQLGRKSANRNQFEKRYSDKLLHANRRLRLLSVSLKERYQHHNTKPDSDFTLVAVSGTEIKINSKIVKEKMPLLEMMLDDNKVWIETTQKRMQLPISEDSLYVLVSYIYGDALWKGMVKTSAIALELIEGAHCLQMTSLISEVIELVLCKHESWIPIPVAVRLYSKGLLIENIQLKEKALRAMRLKRSQVSKSPMFRKLKADNPDLAQQLLAALRRL